jgi:hypothetical protein
VKLVSLPASGAISNLTKSVGTAALRLQSNGTITLRKPGAADIASSTAPLTVDGRYHYVVMTKNGGSVTSTSTAST